MRLPTTALIEDGNATRHEGFPLCSRRSWWRKLWDRVAARFHRVSSGLVAVRSVKGRNLEVVKIGPARLSIFSLYKPIAHRCTNITRIEEVEGATMEDEDGAGTATSAGATFTSLFWIVARCSCRIC